MRSCHTTLPPLLCIFRLFQDMWITCCHILTMKIWVDYVEKEPEEDPEEEFEHQEEEPKEEFEEDPKEDPNEEDHGDGSGGGY